MNDITTEVNEVASELYTGKVIRDGKVAVLVSPGFGAGWSTWDGEYGDAILFDPTIVTFIEQEKYEEIETYATLKYPELYLGGLRDLVIVWVPQGSAFRINEYDGSESIEYLDSVSWIVA